MAKAKTVPHHKLVRDGIPKKIRDNGEIPKIRKLSEYEKRHYLLVKLGEESKEALEANDDTARKLELVDVLEVLSELLRIEGLSWRDIRALQAEKRRLVGGFRNGTFLETTSKG